MAVDPNKRNVACAYTSEDGNIYALVQKKSHATASGAGGATGLPGYPRGWTPRCVHGIGSDGIQKATLTIMSASNALYSGSGTSFTIPGDGVFTITGRTGEKRPRPAPPAS